MEKSRREFLRKSLKIGVGAGAVGAVATSVAAKGSDQKGSNGVVQGKSTKKEVLYYKSENWEKYYKIAY